jgi:hypothetical protein
MSANTDTHAPDASSAHTAAAVKDYTPPKAVGAWLTKLFGLRWLRASYDKKLWDKCDEVIPLLPSQQIDSADGWQRH